MKISLPPERVFASSDFHGYHKNICSGCTTWEKGTMRDFPDEVTMTLDLVDKVNNVVGEDDILLHLGDWSFGGKDKVKVLRDMIKCKNIIALKGNHCYHICKSKELQGCFTKWYGEVDVDPILHLTVGKHRYVCSHYALRVWEDSQNGVRNIYGHSHGSLPNIPGVLGLDVGFDCHKNPLNFLEIEQIFSTQVWSPVDHHK